MDTFSDLLEKARRGDERALGTLYERYAGPMMGAARRRLGPDLRRWYDTLDLTHSVFLDVMKDLTGFEDRGEPAFRRWLGLKAENKARDKLRKHMGRYRKRRQEALPPPDALLSPRRTPLTEVSRLEEQQSARDIYEALPEDAQDIVRLRLEEGLSFVEIARRTGLPSPDAARKRFSRCLARIRRNTR